MVVDGGGGVVGEKEVGMEVEVEVEMEEEVEVEMEVSVGKQQAEKTHDDDQRVREGREGRKYRGSPQVICSGGHCIQRFVQPFQQYELQCFKFSKAVLTFLLRRRLSAWWLMTSAM